MAQRPDVDGRQLLLDAALKLFAQEGVEGVSIRAVNREAGVGPASVHYHFGSKDGLLDEVLLVHGKDVRTKIAERAKRLIAEPDAGSPRDLVEMYAQPYLELLAEHPRSGAEWLRLVGRLTQSDPDRISDRATTRLTQQAAAAIYPDAAAEAIAPVMRMCVQVLVTQLTRPGSSRRGKPTLDDVELLVDFLAGGLDSALSSSEPSASKAV